MMILFGLYYEGEELATDDNVEPLPTEFGIMKIYPNPFNPSTTIRFDTPIVETRFITSLQIFDITGHLVETLMDGTVEPGIHEIQWYASRESSGIYFVRLQSREFVETQKIVLVK